MVNSICLLAGSNPGKKKLVHILSATSVAPESAEAPANLEAVEATGGMTVPVNGRPSDPCEEAVRASTPTVRTHAYGTCASNGGQPRQRRSIGVCTKDDKLILANGGPTTASKNGTSKNGSARSNSASDRNVRCLKLRLRSKFRSAASPRRPSKETREVIDMGKLPSSSSGGPQDPGAQGPTKKRSPLNGILKKMESKTAILADGNSMVSRVRFLARKFSVLRTLSEKMRLQSFQI